LHDFAFDTRKLKLHLFYKIWPTIHRTFHLALAGFRLLARLRLNLPCHPHPQQHLQPAQSLGNPGKFSPKRKRFGLICLPSQPRHRPSKFRHPPQSIRLPLPLLLRWPRHLRLLHRLRLLRKKPRDLHPPLLRKFHRLLLLPALPPRFIQREVWTPWIKRLQSELLWSRFLCFCAL
jgi:hypothetical protein